MSIKNRDDKIRTCDPRDPNTVRYQAALHPDRYIQFSKYRVQLGILTFCFALYTQNVRYIPKNTKSGRQDLNLRPPRPKRGALPSCATSRKFVYIKLFNVLLYSRDLRTPIMVLLDSSGV